MTNYINAYCAKDDLRDQTERFFKRLEFDLKYDFDIVLNIRTNCGEKIFRFKINSNKNEGVSSLKPLLHLKGSDITFQKIFMGAGDIGTLYRDEKIGAFGDLFLLGAISNAVSKQYRNS